MAMPRGLMKNKLKWMIIFKNRNAILLHLNGELSQYKKLKRVDTKKLMQLLKEAY